ncbi:MAG TPA: hypothetical protein VNI84_02385, partial [Pyrinomonadaceae bacterium]|nr:hypothetical protein [Pyrinomonadaceae bacterium]
MKFKVFIGFFILVFSFAAVFSQTAQTSPLPTRNRIVVSYPTPTPTPASKVVVTNNLPAPTLTPTPRPTVTPFQNPAAYPSATPSAVYPTPAPVSPTFFKPLAYKQIKSKIEEAKRQMTTRPIPTALTDIFL